MEVGHDLVEFVRQASREMSSEYQRIRARTREDPGTAGDQGEENWAELLRRWLPASYHVETKGRILSSAGQASRQVDVLVLSPLYPRGLLGKKHYLAAGVLAAFECKTTLRPHHIRSAVETSVALGVLSRDDKSSVHHIIYGVLAHSSVVPSKKISAQDSIGRLLAKADADLVRDPRDCLDFLCVADLGTWALMRAILGTWATSYMGPMRRTDAPLDSPELIGRFLTGLLGRLGQVEPELRPIARYFQEAGLYGLGAGLVRYWDWADVPDGTPTALWPSSMDAQN